MREHQRQIHYILSSKGWSHEDLAENIGCDRSTIWRLIKRNNGFPSPRVGAEIERIFKLTKRQEREHISAN